MVVGDLRFATWNGLAVEGFQPLAVVPVVSIIRGGGQAGSDRLKIEFGDGDVRNTWLRVTIAGGVTATTGLASPDVFYFGNAIGELGVGNLGTVLRVNATDTANVRQNQSINSNSVGISRVHDLNKDGRVNASDTAITRQNVNGVGVIDLITAPASLVLASEGGFAAPPVTSPGSSDSEGISVGVIDNYFAAYGKD